MNLRMNQNPSAKPTKRSSSDTNEMASTPAATTTTVTAMTSINTTKKQDSEQYQTQKSRSSSSQSSSSASLLACRNHQRRPSKSMIFNRKCALSGFVCLALAVFLLAPPSSNQLVEGAKLKKAVKSIAKGLIFQQLSTRKNFLPLPVPIPVPIEINEDPIYLKGKPKYVNVYKQPKPTPQPIVKPTTVYHMPIYSPTYEYMSMDPMNSMYNSPMMYGSYGGSTGPSSYKSSVNTDADSTSSVASANHGASSNFGGMNFNDYDDESGSYYMRKAAAKRRKLLPGEYASSINMNRNDPNNRNDDDQNETMRKSNNQPSPQQSREIYGIQHYVVRDSEGDIESARPDDDESYDHEGDEASWVRNHNHNMQHGRRVKRQVYYESGYDGNTNCEGFPLEINVRSRIKLDRVFPIHGKSQIKKCVKIKKTLLPPPTHDDY